MARVQQQRLRQGLQHVQQRTPLQHQERLQRAGRGQIQTCQVLTQYTLTRREMPSAGRSGTTLGTIITLGNFEENPVPVKVIVLLVI